jgi:hypothetical protein
MSTSDGPITVGEGKVEIRDGGVVSVDGNEVATMKVVTLAIPTRSRRKDFPASSGRANRTCPSRYRCPVKSGVLDDRTKLNATMRWSI